MSLYAFYEQYFPFWKALKEEDKNYLCENTAEEHFDKEQPVHDNMGCSGFFYRALRQAPPVYALGER